MTNIQLPRGAISICLIFPILMYNTMSASVPCSKETPPLNQPALPDLNMTAFTVQYRATIKDKSYTLWAKESYDSVKNKVRMDFQRNGLNSSILFDYEDNTYIVYEFIDTKSTDYKCNIKYLDQSKSDNFDIFGFREDAVGVPHVISSQEILQFTKALNPVYKGRTELWDLTVDHWQSCVIWDDAKATFTLDYYFTTPDFRSVGELTPAQIPVRATIKGTIQGDNGKTTNLDHIYEYIQFKAHETLPAETFSLPEFMVCSRPMFLWAKSFPSISPTLSYTLETVTHTPDNNGGYKVDIQVKTVYRDATRRLLREDTLQSISISDFNTGVEYLIDGLSCTTRPVDPKHVESAVKKANGKISMGNDLEIEYLTGVFELTGDKRFREQPATAFARMSGGGDYMVEAYLNKKENPIPLGLVVYHPKTGVKIYYHIYSFVESFTKFDTDPFDIRRCRNSNEITDFDITLDTGTSHEIELQRNSEGILRKLREEVADAAKISILQISHNDFYINTEKSELHWYGGFLGPDHPSRRANVEESLVMESTDDIFFTVTKTIKNKKLRVKYTNAKDDISFDLKALKIRSARDEFSLSIQADDALFRFNKKKDHCVDFLENDFINSATHSERDCGQVCLDNQWVDCNAFQYNLETKSCHYGRQTKTPNLQETPGCDYFSLSYLQSFDAFPGTVMLKAENSGKWLEAENAELCAEHCIDEESFNCESFDFCESATKCVLHEVRDVNKDSSSHESDQNECIHYTRKGTENFLIVAKTSLNFEDQVTMTTNTLSDCADICVRNSDGCAMFSTCLLDGKQVCSVVPTYKAEEVKFSHDSNCNVYKFAGYTKSDEQEACITCASKVSGQASGKGHTPGAMITVGLSMVFAGIFIGAASAYFLYRNRNGESRTRLI